MNTINKIAIIVLLTMFCSTIAISQNLQPTKPAKAVDTLKYPKPVKDDDAKVSLIPQKVKFAITTKLDGKIPESYNFTANVKDIKEGTLTMVSQDNKPADVTYKLPEGMNLKINKGDNITLYKNALIVGAGLGYDQYIKLGNSLKIASSKLYGDNLLTSKLLPGVSIKQTTIDRESVRESEFMKSMKVKVVLAQSSGSTPLSTGKVNEVVINRVSYQIYVQASSYTEAKPGSIEPEFQGYLLEYYIVEK